MVIPTLMARPKIVQDKFVLFGDSITEFSSSYPHGILTPRLTDLYIRKLDIICRGFSGYNTEQAILMLPEILKAENSGVAKIKLMTLFFGSNDAADKIQDVPLDIFAKNMELLIEMILKLGIKLILITPGLHGIQKWASNKPKTNEKRSNKTNAKYADIIIKLGDKFNLPVVQLIPLFACDINYTVRNGDWVGEIGEDIPGTELLLADGIHFTERGYNILLSGVLSAIETHYPEYSHHNMNRVLNYWQELDRNNLEETMFVSAPPNEIKANS